MSDDETSWANRICAVNRKRKTNALLRTPRAFRQTSSAIRIVTSNNANEYRVVTLFSSNDYLGLSSHPDVKHAVAEAAKTFGNGVRSSAIVAGHSHVHELLERELAALMQCEACLLFPTGFAANLGTIAALCAQGSVAIFSDALNHASLIDGTRMAARAGCQLHVYRHLDYGHLEELMEDAQATLSLIVTDGVFSMDGDIADIQALVKLKRRFGSLLLVDDAHGSLVLGERGGGSVEACGCCADVDIHTGTLSKAFGALGGFVACSAEIKSFLVNHARPYIYSTALPVPVAAGALAALTVQRRERWRALHLRQLMDMVEKVLSVEVRSPIIVLPCGSEDAALQLSDRLWHLGFHCPAIRPPTVPTGTSRLRITLTAEHTNADVQQLLQSLNSLIDLPSWRYAHATPITNEECPRQVPRQQRAKL